jgi:3-dehydroquinate dehydratase II
MAHIVILNGPNLNLVGRRQPEIYGSLTFDEYIPELREKYSEHTITYHQSNHEGALIDWLHLYGYGGADGILINAGGYTHTSIALADAVKGIETPVVEIHISNIYERESYRHVSFLKEVCVHSILGHGMPGYEMGVQYFLDKSYLAV